MSGQKNHWVPDYYPNFACKGPECRACCCQGWDVSISLDEYFRLIGLDCSAPLRKKLDCAFYVLDQPDPSKYARIKKNYLGDCPLHGADGYCALQKEEGEEAIPAICRYYPRGPRLNPMNECSCACSCEATLELMFQDARPLAFHEEPLAFDIPGLEGPKSEIPYYRDIRVLSISVLQDRSFSLPERLTRLGRMMKLLSAASGNGAHAMRLALKKCRLMARLAPVNKNPNDANLEALGELLHKLGGASRSVASYVETAHSALGLGTEEALSRYQEASAHFDRVLPDWPIYFEHMLVNHIFFEQFPFADERESLYEEYVSLCAVFAFIRTLAVGYMANKSDMRAFVDVCAAAFRLIDHSTFEYKALGLLKSMNACGEESLSGLLPA